MIILLTFIFKIYYLFFGFECADLGIRVMEDKLLEINWEDLKRAAVEAAAGSYSKYSGFVVGAAVLAKNGQIYTGTNVENAAYGVGLCAECGAISDMVKDGQALQLVAAIAILLKRDGEVVVITPCGRCRQLLFEHGGAGALVWSPKFEKPLDMDYWLPEGFGSDSLKLLAV